MGEVESEYLIEIDLAFISSSSVQRNIKILPSDISEFDPNEISEEARMSNTSFKYSGRHDHGDLPKMKSSGYYSKICSALYKAKSTCDELLTNEINSYVKNTKSDFTDSKETLEVENIKKKIKLDEISATEDIITHEVV